MPVSTTLNDLSKLALVASDTSYFTSAHPVLPGSALAPLDEEDPTILPRFDFAAGFFEFKQFPDAPGIPTGFKAITYEKNVAGSPKEVVLAFGGTDGPNPTDWVANTQHLGWNQWRENRAQIFTYLNGLPADTKITFTGQSLGGTLAQYAAYEWIKSKIDADPTFDKSRINLITYNALGGYLGLTSNLGPYQASVLDGLGQAAHYVITGDLVSRLGGDPTTGIGHVGGQVYLLDYRTVNPDTGELVKLDLIEGHRIESGFYAGLHALDAFTVAQDLFSTTSPQQWYLPMASLQNAAGLLGNILNGRDVGRAESYPRLLAGLMAGMTFGNQQEWDTLVKAYLTNQHDAGKLSDSMYAFYSAAILPVTVAGKPVTAAIYTASVVLAGLADALGLGLSSINVGLSTLKEFFQLPSNSGPQELTTLSQHELAEKAALVLAVTPSALPGSQPLSQELASLNLTPEAFAQQLLNTSGSTWRTDVLAALPQQLQDLTDKTRMVRLTNAFYATLSGIPELGSEELTLLAQEREAVTIDTASGFANAMADFTQKITNVAFNLGQTISNFADIQLIDQAYAEELNDPRLSSTVRAAVEEARDIVQRAGQMVVVQQGIGPNPFNTPGFNPATAPFATGTMREDGATAFTAYLPYAAGTGGQSVQLKLNGLGANTVTVLSNGQELTPQNGIVPVLVPEGQQQLLFILRAPDVSANTVLSVNAVLVNSAGTATHVERQEATVSLVDSTIEYDDGRPVVTITSLVPAVDDNHHYVVLASEGGSVNGQLALLSGNDQIYGSGLGEFITGGYGHDRIYGGDGNDTILGGSYFLNQEPTPIPFEAADGDDVVDGQGGNDEIEGDGGHDRLYGGEGNDRLFGDAGTYGSYVSPPGGDDLLDGGAGDDFLWGEYGADILVGGDGNDRLTGDYIVHTRKGFPAPPPFVFDTTRAMDDFLDGGAGADLLYGDGGNDTLVGGAGNDQLYGDYGEGAFLASDGDLFTIAGNDVLDGGGGDDFLLGMGGDDVLNGGDEADTLHGGDGTDELFGGAGDDLLYGDGLNNQFALSAVGAADFLDGGAGNDHLEGGMGDDTLFGGTENDVLFGEEGADSLFGDDGDDELQGGDGIDLLGGDAGDDLLFGQADNDTLFGDEGNDQLAGNDGNDALYGGVGNDILQGGKGNDVLIGGAGHDAYNFSLGDGQDTITDTAFAGEGNVIQFFSGITLQSLTFFQDHVQQTLTIQVAGGDSIRLLGFDPNASNYVVDTLDFADGTIVALADQLPLPGGLIEGTADDNVIRTGATDDTIFAGAGNDTVNAGAGNDLILGQKGNDFLVGGAGQDRYVFNTGDGTDTISDTAFEGNRLVFGAGIGSESVTLGIDVGDTLVVRAGNTGEAVRVNGFGVNTSVGAHPIDSFEFADGTVLTYSQLVARGFQLFGTSGGETLVGTSFIDRITAGSGNDVVRGLDGADTLLGEDGADQLRGGAGDDILDGGAGNDQLWGEAGTDVLYGGAGDDRLTADVGPDRLVGGDGNDTYVLFETGYEIVEFANGGIDTATIGFSGSFTFVLPVEIENIDLVEDIGFSGVGTEFVGNQLDNRMTGPGRLDGREGNDTLIGVGDNIYVFGRGYGQDVIQTGLQAHASSGFVDQIQLLPGVAPAEVTLEGQGKNLVLKIAGTSDQLAVENYLIEPGLRVPTVGEILFDDGTRWNSSEIESRVRFITGTNGNDSLAGFGNDNEISGLDGNDQLVGLGGNDRLDGGAGNDVLVGGDGHDTYLFGRGGGQDRVSDFPDNFTAGEVDAVLLDNTITPGDIRLHATSDLGLLLTINGTTDQLLVESYFFGALDQIEQIKFADGTIWDAAAIASRTEGLTLVGTDGPDVLTGIFANDTLSGLGGDDTLTGGAGNDLLDGGLGTDTLVGGTGNDLYIVDNPGDVVTEQVNQGTDTVQSAITYTLGANVEHLTLTGTSAVNGTGNTGNNTLTGNSAANILSGGAGNDTYLVGVGDTVVEQASGGTDTVQSAVSWTLGSNVENLTLTGTLAINAIGNTGNNNLVGNSGNNIVNGGTGADSTMGGAGDDTYVVDNTGDTVIENANEGIDMVQSSLTYTLGANVEHLTLTGTTAINATGNTMNNVLTGNSAVNVLNGGTGADTMVGGGGNDTYVVDNVGDVVTEAAGAGIDTVQSSITYVLGNEVENLTLTGSAAINGTGNALNNTLTGNTGNNTLNGGAGADAMSGGTGNDTYVVDNVSDTVTESASAGTDVVQSAVTFTLGMNIENLTLTGTGAINGTGNTLANTLVGNSGTNILSGGTGADTMSGGAGDDTYVVDVTGDVVMELANEGADTVQSAIAYTLGSNVEHLTLTGTSAINGTGNALDNVLTGNSGANVLTGGVGNDTYIVGTGDSIVENAGAGTDTVQSSITWTLGANLENLTLTGTGTINGTGNTLNNILTGNSGVNVLTGGAGNDTYVVGTGDSVVENAGAGTDTVQSSITWTLGADLENLTLVGTTTINGTGNASNNTVVGNSGNNVLTGLGGNDTYQYSRGGGQDRVIDNSGASDTMQFGVTINPLDLVISRQANDLRLTIHGSTDQVTIQNWYSGATNQAEIIQAGNGQTMLNTQVDQLIQAMAGFTAQTGLTWDQAIDQRPQEVQTVLAASWQ